MDEKRDPFNYFAKLLLFSQKGSQPKELLRFLMQFVLVRLKRGRTNSAKCSKAHIKELLTLGQSIFDIRQFITTKFDYSHHPATASVLNSVFGDPIAFHQYLPISDSSARQKLAACKPIGKKLIHLYEAMFDTEYDGVLKEVASMYRGGQGHAKFHYSKFSMENVVGEFEREQNQIQNQLATEAMPPIENAAKANDGNDETEDTQSQTIPRTVIDKETQISDFRRRHASRCLGENCSLQVLPGTQVAFELAFGGCMLVQERTSIGEGVHAFCYFTESHRDPVGLLPKHSVAALPPTVDESTWDNFAAAAKKQMTKANSKVTFNFTNSAVGYVD